MVLIYVAGKKNDTPFSPISSSLAQSTKSTNYNRFVFANNFASNAPGFTRKNERMMNDKGQRSTPRNNLNVTQRSKGKMLPNLRNNRKDITPKKPQSQHGKKVTLFSTARYYLAAGRTRKIVKKKPTTADPNKDLEDLLSQNNGTKSANVSNSQVKQAAGFCGPRPNSGKTKTKQVYFATRVLPRFVVIK